MTKATFALVLSGCLLTLSARGESVLQSSPFSFNFSLADAFGDTSSGTAVKPLTRNTEIDPLAVTAFDPALGTLTGVTVTLQISVSTSQFILHNSWESSSGSIVQLSTFGAGYVLEESTSVSGNFLAYGSLDGATGSSLIVNTGANFLGAYSASKTDIKTLSLTDYALMQKDGQLLFSLYLSGDADIANNHPLYRYFSAEGEATVSGSLSVTYEYDAVPEPGTVLLLLGAMLPLARRLSCGSRNHEK